MQTFQQVLIKTCKEETVILSFMRICIFLLNVTNILIEKILYAWWLLLHETQICMNIWVLSYQFWIYIYIYIYIYILVIFRHFSSESYGWTLGRFTDFVNFFAWFFFQNCLDSSKVYLTYKICLPFHLILTSLINFEYALPLLLIYTPRSCKTLSLLLSLVIFWNVIWNAA